MFNIKSSNQMKFSAERLIETRSSVVHEGQGGGGLRATSLANREPAKGGQVRVQQRGRTWEQRRGKEGGGEDVPR